MIDKHAIFEIHRLADAGLSLRRIAARLGMSRKTVKKYLKNPNATFAGGKPRESKLAPCRPLIDEFLQQEPDVHATVVLQRLREKGFDGQITIVRDYIREKRGRMKTPTPFIRFESAPGEQMQVDWGHFGSLAYGQTRRKLYALVVTESYSRMMHATFTHSQRQEALHQALYDGFSFFGGAPKTLLVDNMLTAVSERRGPIIRFNAAFLDFLRPLKIDPRACNVRAPHEKGKVERAVGYLRRNFWPLRTFSDLDDVQRQADEWRDAVANVRVHQTTGKRPADMAEQMRSALRPLPDPAPDLRETLQLKVHKDFAVHFDGNAYTAPPRMIGKFVVVKADAHAVTLYHGANRIAVHRRSWERKQRILNPAHEQQVKKMRKRLWRDRQVQAVCALGEDAVHFLQMLAQNDRPVKKSVETLLSLKDRFGAKALMSAVGKAAAFKAWNVESVENILRQETTKRETPLPVRLKDEALSRIRLEEPSLADYDNFISQKVKDDD